MHFSSPGAPILKQINKDLARRLPNLVEGLSNRRQGAASKERSVQGQAKAGERQIIEIVVARHGNIIGHPASGSLEPGKWADFIIVDRDYFEIPASEIDDIQVIETWVGGERVFAVEED